MSKFSESTQGKFSEKSNGLPEGVFIFKGEINIPADFPTKEEVQIGWTYGVGTDVTDNDPSKTDTGQSFLEGDEITWAGSSWFVWGGDAIWSSDGSTVKTLIAQDIDFQNKHGINVKDPTEDHHAVNKLYADGVLTDTDYNSTGMASGGGVTATPTTTVFTVPAGTDNIVWNALTQTERLATWTQFTNIPLIAPTAYPITYVAVKFVDATPTALNNVVTLTNDNDGNVTDIADVDTGFGVATTQQGSPTQPEISTITTNAATTLSGGEYLTFSTTADNYALWMYVNGSGSAPALPGVVNIQVTLAGTEDADATAAIIKTTIEAFLHVKQSPIPYTPKEQQEWLVQGVVEHSTGVINTVASFGMSVLYNNGQFIHIIKRVFRGIALKDFQIKYYPNGANLNIRRTSTIPPTLQDGKILTQGSGRDAGLPETPDINLIIAYDQTPMQYVWVNDVGQLQVEAPSLTVKTDKYQNGSATLQTIPAGKFSVQWVVSFGSIAVIIFGTKIYDSFFVAHRSMLTQKIPDIIKISADALGASRNYDNSVICARLVIKSGETSLLSSDALLLNFDSETDVVFVDNVNRGIISPFNVTPDTGLNFHWDAGQVFDQPNAKPFRINANAGSAFDNAINYIYWDQSAQLTELSLAVVKPVAPDVLVAEIAVSCGSIDEIDQFPDLTKREADREDAGVKLHPFGAFQGMLVRADPDVTSLLDFKMTSGEFVKNANQTIPATAIFSRTTALKRHFLSGGVWTCDFSADADPANWNNGTNRIPISPASQYKADAILYTHCTVAGDRLHYVYGQTLYGNQAAAQAGAADLTVNFPFGLPDGLNNVATLVAIVLQGAATVLPVDASADWVDLRTGVAAGAGGATTFTTLADTPSGYSTANALYRVNSGLTGIEEGTITNIGNDLIGTGLFKANDFEATISSGLAFKVTPTGTDTAYFGRDGGGLNALGFHATLGTLLSSVSSIRMLIDTNNNETVSNFQVRHNSPDFNGGSLLFEVAESGAVTVPGLLETGDIRGISAGNVVFKTDGGGTIMSVLNGIDVITERYWSFHEYSPTATPAIGYSSLQVYQDNIFLTINNGGTTTSYTLDKTAV